MMQWKNQLRRKPLLVVSPRARRDEH